MTDRSKDQINILNSSREFVVSLILFPNGQTNEQTIEQTDKQTDGNTDGQQRRMNISTFRVTSL